MIASNRAGALRSIADSAGLDPPRRQAAGALGSASSPTRKSSGARRCRRRRARSALSGFIDEMRRTRADEFTEISLAVVKLMGRGEYVAHAPDEPDIGHFGLATMEYAHATAPNRRYPDLVTQRILKAHARGAAAALSRAGADGDRGALYADGGAGGEGRAARAEVGRGAAANGGLGRQHVRRHHHRRRATKGSSCASSRPPAEGKLVRGANASPSDRRCRCAC